MTLDRLRLPLPKGVLPRWTLHVVEAGGGNNRIFGFFGTGTQAFGCCGRPRERILKTAAQIADWCHGAWPVYLRPAGPFYWLPQAPTLERFVVERAQQLEVVMASPWSTTLWYVRYEDGRALHRRFGWFDCSVPQSPRWGVLQAYCEQLASRTIEFRRARGQG